MFRMPLPCRRASLGVALRERVLGVGEVAQSDGDRDGELPRAMGCVRLRLEEVIARDGERQREECICEDEACIYFSC